MKTIIRENYYQRKLWDESCFERDLKSGRLDDLLGDESDFQKRRAESYAEVQRVLKEREAALHTMPSLIGRIKFKLASRYAVAVARHHEMNVHIKASGSLGVIELIGDEIMFDTVWKDGNRKRRFLLLFLLASGVCVQGKTESGNTFLSIWLSYGLERRIRI